MGATPADQEIHQFQNHVFVNAASFGKQFFPRLFEQLDDSFLGLPLRLPCAHERSELVEWFWAA